MQLQSCAKQKTPASYRRLGPAPEIDTLAWSTQPAIGRIVRKTSIRWQSCHDPSPNQARLAPQTKLTLSRINAPSGNVAWRVEHPNGTSAHFPKSAPGSIRACLAGRVKRLPPLITLRYLAVALRTGSFAEAARELHVTSAAISHQIKALEDELGVELFVRHRRKVSPTAAARAALPILEDGFSALADAVTQLRAFGETKWIITVCAEPLFATKWLVPRLHRFYSRCPDAEVRLQTSQSSIDAKNGEAVEAATFQKTGVDLAVRFGHGRYPDLETSHLLQISLVPVCSPALADDLPFSSCSSMIRYPLISDRSMFRASERLSWHEWFRHSGLSPPEGYRERVFGNGLLALEAAATAQGTLLTSRHLIETELDTGKLVIALDSELPCQLGYYAVCPSASLARPVVQAFRKWLADEAR